MGNRHCSKTPEDCAPTSGNAVVDAENFLVRTFGDCSGQENHERVEQILITLKAIGNAKRPASAQSAIIRCAVKSQHSNITMSSFDAVRGMPCGDALGELQEVVSNENLGADKRIYAFRAAMKCPTKNNLEFLHTTRRSSSCLVKPTLLSSSSIPSLSRSSATARRWAVSSVRQPTSCTLPTTGRESPPRSWRSQ